MDAKKLIDPELKPMADAIPSRKVTRETLAETREMSAATREQMQLPPTSVSVSQQMIQTNDGEIKLHIYKPENAPKDNPALLWFHGGGYITGSSDDFQALLIAESCRCTVISVDYRVAPEHPFPAGPNDGYAALEWVQKYRPT